MEYLIDKSKAELIVLVKKLQLEIEHQKSADLFKRLFDAIPDAVFITRIGGENPGRILDVNIAAERQTGYDRKELLAMNILNDLATGVIMEATLKEREGELENRESIRFTEKKRRKDGSEYWTDVLTIMINFNNVNAALSVNRDITELKNVEEAIRKSEEKYHVLADNSIDVIWQTDLKLVFSYVSPSVKNMMGYTVDEWVGTRLSQHASTKEFIKMAKNAFFAIKNYKEFKHIAFDAVMLRKDGTEIPVEITGRLLLNKKGLPIGLQGTTRDITERKQAEEELKKHREHLEELVKERTAELEEKNEKLEHFNKLFVGREFRIKELRDRVKELENKISDKR